MSPATPQPEGNNGKNREFTTTHWSVVLEAGQKDSPGAVEALERLCRMYWYPLYVFIRRKGHSPHDAQDLTQEFFARFLEKQYIALADQSRGKFRTFLIRSLEHFLINEWIKGQAIKRPGAHHIICWEEAQAEQRYLAEGADGVPPDKMFIKRWAMSLLEQVMGNLRQEFCTTKEKAVFEALKASVWGEETAVPYEKIGAQLGMTEGAVKGAAYRMRHRYRELLRAEVAQTVATAAEVDDELRYLVAALRS
jgi:RNA polymerase sigma factor (sigma-70 family)